jgi:hypothetical protein
MGSGLQNLDRESLLMLYAAGELTNGDLKRVEEMLASDPSMRAELEQLNVAHDAMTAGFRAADATSPLPAPVSSSVWRLAAPMKQWYIDRLNARTNEPMRSHWRFAWLYTAGAVAASIVVVIFVLWSRVDDGKGPVVDIWQDNAAKTDEPPADANANPSASSDAVAVAPDPDDYTPASTRSADIRLSRAEGELYTLNTLTDSMRSTEDTVTP